MTATSIAEASGNLAAPAILPPPQLPDHSRAMDAARFSQLFMQAQEQQAQVQFTNPGVSAASPGLEAVSRGISSSSADYLGTVDKGLKSLAHVDLADPKSLANTIQHFTMAQVQSVQLSAVLGEVSSSKKSLQTLFQNQG